MKGKRDSLFASVVAAVSIIGIFAFSSTANNTSFATTTSPGQEGRAITDEFLMEDCDNFTPTGTNPYLILEPNRQAVFRGEEDGEVVERVDTVLMRPKRYRVLKQESLKRGKRVMVSLQRCRGTS
jgi:hypothetical protein